MLWCTAQGTSTACHGCNTWACWKQVRAESVIRDSLGCFSVEGVCWHCCRHSTTKHGSICKLCVCVCVT
jgi:hypothetical protein